MHRLPRITVVNICWSTIKRIVMLDNESHSLTGRAQVFSKRNNKCICITLTILAVFVLGTGIIGALAAGPLHARCSVKWNISLPCHKVSSLLVDQIKNWTTEGCTAKSQRCLYALVSVDKNDIIATHTTPVMGFVDDITFASSPTEAETCVVLGRSVSRSWYALLDSGTNYLNMWNLMDGSGLSISSFRRTHQ